MYKWATYNIVKPPENSNITFEPPKIKYDEELMYQYTAPKQEEEEIAVENVPEETQVVTEQNRRKFKNKPKKQYDHTISFKELCDHLGLKVRITSEYRPGGKTKQGRVSNHSRKNEWGQSMATDVVPVDGDFENFKNTLLNSPEARNWFEKRGYGIINEVIPQVLSSTGGTGKHFHVGPDRWARKVWNTWLANPSMSVNNYIPS